MQLLAFILLYPILWCISILPHRLFYGFSDVVFFFVYSVFGYRRKVVRDNLTLVFPNKTGAEINRIEKDFFKHMCDMFLEMVKTMNLSKEQVKKKYKVLNIDVLKELEKERSILIVCSHYANWEWNVSINNYVDSKGYAVYQKIANKYFDAFIRKVRARWNTTLINQRETVKTVVRDKRDGITGIFGLVSDQSPQRHRAQYWSDFMGIRVPVFNGAETMARKLDLAVVFLKVSKVKRGYYQAEFITIAEQGKQTEENEITEAFLRLTENQINEKPEHYFWTHKRWKHRGKQPAHFAKTS
jgi:KDO2-lipid IV(A) lauroyltransferase